VQLIALLIVDLNGFDNWQDVNPEAPDLVHEEPTDFEWKEDRDFFQHDVAVQALATGNSNTLLKPPGKADVAQPPRGKGNPNSQTRGRGAVDDHGGYTSDLPVLAGAVPLRTALTPR